MTALELLQRLVELESPTSDAERLSPISASSSPPSLSRWADASSSAGSHLVSRMGDGGPPLVLAAHMDTVWPTAR